MASNKEVVFTDEDGIVHYVKQAVDSSGNVFSISGVKSTAEAAYQAANATNATVTALQATVNAVNSTAKSAYNAANSAKQTAEAAQEAASAVVDLSSAVSNLTAQVGEINTNVGTNSSAISDIATVLGKTLGGWFEGKTLNQIKTNMSKVSMSVMTIDSAIPTIQSDILDAANSAQDAANLASNAASNAQSAMDSANNAIDQVEEAKGLAEEASSAATNALNAANYAQNVANNAKETTIEQCCQNENAFTDSSPIVSLSQISWDPGMISSRGNGGTYSATLTVTNPTDKARYCRGQLEYVGYKHAYIYDVWNPEDEEYESRLAESTELAKASIDQGILLEPGESRSWTFEGEYESPGPDWEGSEYEPKSYIGKFQLSDAGVEYGTGIDMPVTTVWPDVLYTTNCTVVDVEISIRGTSQNVQKSWTCKKNNEITYNN